jgi:hypothetical protein
MKKPTLKQRVNDTVYRLRSGNAKYMTIVMVAKAVFNCQNPTREMRHRVSFYLCELCKKGIVERQDRGIYRFPKSEPTAPPLSAQVTLAKMLTLQSKVHTLHHKETELQGEQSRILKEIEAVKKSKDALTRKYAALKAEMDKLLEL